MRVLILFIFLIQSAQAIECHKAIKRLLNKLQSAPADEVQYKLLKQIQKLERGTNKLRIKKTNSEPAMNLKIWKKITRYDALLANDSFAQITREIRPLFREVESAVVIMKRYEKIIKIIDSQIFQRSEELLQVLKSKNIHDELAQAVASRFEKTAGNIAEMTKYYNTVIDENAIHLGYFYHEYKLVRLHLENLATGQNCDALCKENIKRLLNSVGVQSFTEQERFSALVKGAKRASYIELNKALNSHPLAYITRLKRERDEEFKLFWRGLFYEVLPTVEIANILLKTPGLNKSKAIRLIRLVYDRVARLVHFPKVNRIMRSPQETAIKFDMFLNLNTSISPQDELMVTFARRIDAKTKNTWTELIKFAEQNQDQYPDIFARMTESKAKAIARGEISLVHEKSFTTKLAIILTAGGSIAYYHFSKKEIEEIIEGNNILEPNGDPLVLPSEDEEENFNLDGKTMSIKLGSPADKALDSIIDEVTDLFQDIKLLEREPNSIKLWLNPIRLLKEI